LTPIRVKLRRAASTLPGSTPASSRHRWEFITEPRWSRVSARPNSVCHTPTRTQTSHDQRLGASSYQRSSARWIAGVMICSFGGVEVCTWLWSLVGEVAVMAIQAVAVWRQLRTTAHTTDTRQHRISPFYTFEEGQ
jgi:hypothetical protein